MDSDKKALDHRKKIIYLVILILGSLIITGGVFQFFLWRITNIEKYCLSQAKNITGDKWETLLKANDREKKDFPGMDSVTWGFREQYKCGKEQKFFYFF